MLLLLFASVAMQSPSEPAARVAAAVPAQVTVRIVRAAEVRAGRLAASEDSLFRETNLRERDGSLRPASLIEFY